MPIIGGALCIYLMTKLAGATWTRFFVWLAIGLVIYAFCGYRNSVLRSSTRAAPEPQRP